MFQFLFGVAFGAAAYWAWQSFGRDLLGMGDQDTSYGGFSNSTSFSSTPSTSMGSGTSSSTSPSSSATNSATGSTTSGSVGSGSSTTSSGGD